MTTEDRLAALEQKVEVQQVVIRALDKLVGILMDMESENWLTVNDLQMAAQFYEANLPTNEYGLTERQAFEAARAIHISFRHTDCPMLEGGTCQSFTWRDWAGVGELRREFEQWKYTLPRDMQAALEQEGDSNITQGVPLVE